MRPAEHVSLGDGRYRLLRRLGAGGMASVWLARDERLGRSVAVKIVADTLAGDDHWVTRFTREARAAAALAHRGVVPVFDYGVEDGRPYLVMEYVPGGTLAERRDALDPEQVARELLEALAAVHAAGILHRDVKPSNLLIDTHGHVRLTDFGIAQSRDGVALTHPGIVLGTLRYIAPEVAAGRPATVQSDLYSAGFVIRQIAGDPPARLARLVAALTAEDPRDRPDSAPAALALLQRAGAGEEPGTAETRRIAGGERSAGAAEGGHRAAAGATEATRTTGNGKPPTLRTSGPRRISRAAVLGVSALIVAAAVAVVLVLIAPGASSTPDVPSPAPSGAPLSRQVRQMDRIIDRATRP